MPTGPHMLLIIGPAGFGKSALSWEIALQLQHAGVPYAAVNTDELDRVFPAPPGDPTKAALTGRNLRLLWSEFAALGHTRLLLAGVMVDLDADLPWITGAIPKRPSRSCAWSPVTRPSPAGCAPGRSVRAATRNCSERSPRRLASPPSQTLASCSWQPMTRHAPRWPSSSCATPIGSTPIRPRRRVDETSNVVFRIQSIRGRSYIQGSWARRRRPLAGSMTLAVRRTERVTAPLTGLVPPPPVVNFPLPSHQATSSSLVREVVDRQCGLGSPGLLYL
jgi:hypothetical protein